MHLQVSRDRLKIAVLFLIVLISLAARQADAAQTLFVGNDGAPGTINAYALPITASSTPVFAIPKDQIISVGVDSSGNLLAGQLGSQFVYFPAPLSGASTPGATVHNSFNYQFALTPTGDAWVASLTSVVRFNAPFTNASVPAQTLSPPGATGIYGVTLDGAMNLYVVDSNKIYVYAPPYSGTPIVTPTMTGLFFRKIAISGSQLFVAVAGSSPSTILPAGGGGVYNPPLTVASTPAFEITNGVNIPEAVALDASGNLCVGNLGSGNVTVYTSPFSQQQPQYHALRAPLNPVKR